MPYDKIDGKTLDTMLASYKKFFDDTTKAKSDKAPKDKLKDLEKQLKLKSANVGAYMTKLANQAKQLYNEHNLQVEDWLKTATEKHKRLKGGPAELKKKWSDKLFHELIGIVKQLEDTADTAKADSGDLAQAWMEVREGNYNNKNLDPKDIKDFSTIRNGIISGLKATGAKLNKLYQLAAEGKILANEVRLVLAPSSGEVDVEVLTEDIDDLTKKFADKVKEGKELMRTTQESLIRMRGLLDKPKIEDRDVTFNTSNANELLKVTKKVQGEVKVLTMEYQQTEKIGKGKADAALSKAKAQLDEYNKIFKDMLQLYKDMVAVAEKTKKMAAKSKR